MREGLTLGSAPRPRLILPSPSGLLDPGKGNLIGTSGEVSPEAILAVILIKTLPGLHLDWTTGRSISVGTMHALGANHVPCMLHNVQFCPCF